MDTLPPVTPDLGTTPAEKPATSRFTLPPLATMKKIALPVGGVLAAALLIYAGAAYYQQRNRSLDCGSDSCPLTGKSRVNVIGLGATPTDSMDASTLNGLLVAPEKAIQRPLAVMIDNSTEARPQAGLGQADVVYEAPTEGGVTRYMAVYADASKAVRVGPVRSARSYFAAVADELGAAYSHVGGSPDAFTEIRSDKLVDLDQFLIGSDVYQRDLSRHVSLEHTVYSSTDKLWTYATTSLKASATKNLAPWTFQDDLALSKRPAAQSVGVSVSTADYAVSWQYDRATNRYLRSLAGQPQKDANTGLQIGAKTVILQTVASTIGKEGENPSWQVGSRGPVTVIENGAAVKGTWKIAVDGRTRFYDSTQREIPLVRGIIWVQLIPAGTVIS